MLAFADSPATTSGAQPSLDGRRLALTGARVIDGTGRAPIENAAIVVSDGRISAVGPASEVTIPAGVPRIDLPGRTIMPGLVNAHGHLDAGPPELPVRERLARQLELYADYGVTTVAVLGTEPDALADTLAIRDETRDKPRHAARLYVAGPSLRRLKSEDDARARVNAYADQKVDVVKMHIAGNANDTPPHVYAALIDEAHKRGLRVAAHFYYLEDARGLLDAGVDVLAHSVRDQDVDAALIAKIKSRGVGYIPTLTRDLAQFVYETTPPFFADPFFLRHRDLYQTEMAELADPAYQQQVRAEPGIQKDQDALNQAMRNLKLLSAAGVTVAMGTDSGTNRGQWQGYFEHVELEMMVTAGLTPMAALVAATGHAAQVVAPGAEIGTVESGKWADLLVLTANPLDDITNTRRIDSVYIAGQRLPR